MWRRCSASARITRSSDPSFDADARHDQAETPRQAHRGARRRGTRPARRRAGVPLVGPLGGRPPGTVGGRRDRPPDRQHLPPGAGRPLVPATGRIHLVRLRDRLDRFRQEPPSEVAAAGAGVVGARMPRVRARRRSARLPAVVRRPRTRVRPRGCGHRAGVSCGGRGPHQPGLGGPTAQLEEPGPSARTLLVRGGRRLLSRLEPHAQAAG